MERLMRQQMASPHFVQDTVDFIRVDRPLSDAKQLTASRF